MTVLVKMSRHCQCHCCQRCAAFLWDFCTYKQNSAVVAVYSL